MRLISIILPVHNGEKYLEETIQSILTQTYTHFELIVVNDRSCDRSVMIAERFCDIDKRVKLIHNIQGGKLPGTLNFGFLHAVGDYWTWWSDDNLMYPEMLKKFVDVLDENPEYGCVTANSASINMNGDITDYGMLNINQSVLVSNNFGLSFLYRSEIAKKVGAYNTDLFLVEDYDFFIRMSLETKRYQISETLCSIRFHPDCLSMQHEQKIRQKDSELKYNYLKQFKPFLSPCDYHRILVKIYQYHPNKVIKYNSLFLCITLFPHRTIFLILKKIFKK